MGRAKSRPYRLMADKKKKSPVESHRDLPVSVEEKTNEVNITVGKGEVMGEYTITLDADLEKIKAEMSEISPTLKDLKKNNPAKYKEVYRHYMWLVGERDRLANG